MSVTVYKALKHRILAGKKIYLNNAWKTVPGNAKMWLNGTWHKIGNEAAENPVAILVDPEQSLTPTNVSEPSSGTKWYITPDGTGSMDGTSWANAASGSMIHVILLSCVSGDSVYFSEGNYTIDRTITLPAGVSLYGGFETDAETWATRNGFTHQTIFTGDNTFRWMSAVNQSSAYYSRYVDGFVIKNYSGTIAGSKVYLRNSIVSGGTATLEVAYSCIFMSPTTISTMGRCNVFANLTANQMGSLTSVNVYGTSESKRLVKITNYNEMRDSNFYCCSLYIGVPATNCTAVNCSTTSDTSLKSIFGGAATNCTAVNCTTNYESIFGGATTNCIAVNCSSIAKNSDLHGSIFGNTAKGCKAVNCSSSSYFYAAIFGNSAVNCIAVNCSIFTNNYESIFGVSPVNCTAINCLSPGTVFNNSYSDRSINCISWNNSCTSEFDGNKTTCAGSTYNGGFALTLGNDNSIARFTNTGYYPAQGVQDVGDCPSPIDDPTGYAAYIAAFGDWHPAANSFLIGKGTADSNVTTDADGVTRPDPPTIGAYEPVPVSA